MTDRDYAVSGIAAGDLECHTALLSKAFTCPAIKG
jgi:hypothetical protein